MGQTVEPPSCLGLGLVILPHERGIPSKRESSARVDYVPALCTHRPSLLPIGWLSETFGLDRLGGLALLGVRREEVRTRLSRGSKSRNKVTVGEPSVGSLHSRKMATSWRVWDPTMLKTRKTLRIPTPCDRPSAYHGLTPWLARYGRTVEGTVLVSSAVARTRHRCKGPSSHCATFLCECIASA